MQLTIEQKILNIPCLKDHKEHIGLTATQRDARTLYLQFSCQDKATQNYLNAHLMAAIVPRELNVLYGSDLGEGYIQVAGPTGVSFQYSCATSLGNLV